MRLFYFILFYFLLFSFPPSYSLFSSPHAPSPLHLFLSCSVYSFSWFYYLKPTPSHANSVRTARRPSFPSIFSKDSCPSSRLLYSSPHQPVKGKKKKKSTSPTGERKKPQRQRPLQPFASQIIPSSAGDASSRSKSVRTRKGVIRLFFPAPATSKD